MKKILSQVIVLAVVFVLIKDMGPAATKEVTYYQGGSSQTTTNVNNARAFSTIGEAYQQQITLGTDWRIETR